MFASALDRALNLGEAKSLTAAGNFSMLNVGIVFVNKTVGQATTITLPPNPTAGGLTPFRWVVDAKGDAATNNITVVGAAGATIGGAANYVINRNYGAALFAFNGTEWDVLGAANPTPTFASPTLANSTFTGSVNTSVGASTAAAGTTTADAGVLPAGTAAVYPVSAADGTKGVRINAADQVTGRQLTVGNGVSNAVLKIYAPSGGTINGAAADAAYSTASGKSASITCLSGSGNSWLATG